MSNKTIKITSDFFKIGTNNSKRFKQTRKNTPNSSGNSTTTPKINVNSLKAKLLSSVKQQPTSNSFIYDENIDDDNSNNKSQHNDEFNQSIQYLTSLSSLAKKTENTKFTSTPTPTSKTETMHPRNTTLKNQHHTSLSSHNIQSNNLNYNITDSVPYGCLKNGKKPCYRFWKTRKQHQPHTMTSTITTEPHHIKNDDKKAKLDIIHKKLKNLKMSLARANEIEDIPKTTTIAEKKLSSYQNENNIVNELYPTTNTNDKPPMLTFTSLSSTPITPNLVVKMDINNAHIDDNNTDNVDNSNFIHHFKQNKNYYDNEKENESYNDNKNEDKNEDKNENEKKTTKNENYETNLLSLTSSISTPTTISSLTETKQICIPITKKNKKITKKKYVLGKNHRKNAISVLIKNTKTKKKIMDAHKSLTKKPVVEMKKYLKEHNLINPGSSAPPDVVKKIYESSILAGDILNINKENLLENLQYQEQ